MLLIFKIPGLDVTYYKIVVDNYYKNVRAYVSIDALVSALDMVDINHGYTYTTYQGESSPSLQPDLGGDPHTTANSLDTTFLDNKISPKF